MMHGTHNRQEIKVQHEQQVRLGWVPAAWIVGAALAAGFFWEAGVTLARHVLR